VVGWLWMKKDPAVFRAFREMLGVYALLGLLTIVFNATGYMMSCANLSIPQALLLNYTFLASDN